jgi:hypothetical protein
VCDDVFSQQKPFFVFLKKIMIGKTWYSTTEYG